MSLGNRAELAAQGESAYKRTVAEWQRTQAKRKGAGGDASRTDLTFMRRPKRNSFATERRETAVPPRRHVSEVYAARLARDLGARRTVERAAAPC
jgi:hypothetical protein